MNEFLIGLRDWITAIHVIAVIAWMGGMLYLPRLYVYHTQVEPGSAQSELFKVMERFKNVDLHPDRISNPMMGTIFEELIRKFNEALNENPGEHFTPRDVVHLMVDLMLAGDEERIQGEGGGSYRRRSMLRLWGHAHHCQRTYPWQSRPNRDQLERRH